MRAERGFTLIEILVVVIIIGITVGFALLAFGDFGASRRVIVNTEQLSSYIKLVQQRAVLENNTLGIRVNGEGYSTFRLERGLWQQMPAKSIYHTRTFPNNMVVNVQSLAQYNNKRPDVVVDASGGISSFAIKLGTKQNPTIATLLGNTDGQLVIQLPKTST
ncbi:MAG: type II secretion system minor pseudopilin GspH [Tatlockia sp.]|nr:type II secretion system minor pseudopilin GspH [Tatlockia sp.]